MQADHLLATQAKDMQQKPHHLNLTNEKLIFSNQINERDSYWRQEAQPDIMGSDSLLRNGFAIRNDKYGSYSDVPKPWN